MSGLVEHIRKHKDIPDIPKSQRYANRPSLEKIFSNEILQDKTKRDKKISEAVEKYGYRQREIADHLGMYFTSVSRIMKRSGQMTRKQTRPHLFYTLLTEAGIAFSPPPDFVSCPVRENSVFRYQHAVRSPSGALEVRYRIDSFVRLEAERKAAAAGMEALTSVSLDQMHATNFMAVVMNLSGGMFVAPTIFKPETTALLYAADWSALSFIRLANNDFSPDYDSAFVLAIHKDGVADVYVIGLYCDSGGTMGDFDKNNLPADVQHYLAPTLRFS